MPAFQRVFFFSNFLNHAFSYKAKKRLPLNIIQDSLFYTWARGFEPPTFWSVAKRSIQLSYAHIYCNLSSQQSYL